MQEDWQGLGSAGPRITRRQLLLVTSSLAVGVVVAACQSAPSAKPTAAAPTPASQSVAQSRPTAAPVHVIYWTPLDHSQPNPRSKAEAEMVALFTKAHPEVQLTVTTVPWQKMLSQEIQAAQAGKAPDVAQLSTKDLSTAVAANTVMPLDDYVGKDWTADQRVDWLLPLKNLQFGGKQMAYYWNSLLNNLLYYNEDLLHAKNLSVPKSWDELATSAQKITTPRIAGYVMGFSQDGGAVQFINWLIPALWSVGTDVLDDQRELAFDIPTGYKPFQWLVDMYDTYKAIPMSAASFTRDNMLDAFASGAAAMTTLGTNTVSTAEKGKAGKQMGLAQSPGPEAGKPMPAFADGKFLVMGKGSQYPAAAGLFMESQLSPEAQLINAKIAQELPSRKSVIKDSYFSTTAAATLNLSLQYLANEPGRPLQYDRKQAQLQDILASETQKIIVSHKAIPDALKDMASQWNKVKD